MKFKAVCLCALSLTLGMMLACAGGDPVASKAESAWRATLDKDPDNAGKYTMQVASGSSAPLARQLMIEGLDAPKYKAALGAAEAIAKDPFPEAQAKLKEMFDTKAGAIQVQSAVALNKLGDAEAGEWLKGKLGELIGTTRVDVLVFLGKQDREAVTPTLEAMMASKEQQDQDEAYQALGQIQQDWSKERLLKALDTERGENRKFAVAALGKSGDPEVAKKIQKFVNTRGLVFSTLEALGELGNPDSSDAVESMMDNAYSAVRARAAAALWKLGTLENPAEAMQGIIDPEDAESRIEVAEQLASIDDPAALAMLETLAGDEDSTVRQAAVYSLAERSEDAVLPVLAKMVEDKAYTVSTVAMRELGQRGDAAAIDALAPLLDSGNQYVVISAANAILELKERHSGA
ncbi:hypothetical protein ABI59_01770 [Acidobacteria bacterium Mor1]|nr:hypothetical protein ABI59_01770 [Acidobacteria bacterium Mor1]